MQSFKVAAKSEFAESLVSLDDPESVVFNYAIIHTRLRFGGSIS